MTISKRAGGVLLHISSLPGTPGIGTLGKNAYKFVDWLVSAKQTLWQVLPIGPTGYGDSPYASFSTFAGNPLLIDLDILVERGWLTKKAAVPPEYIKDSGNVDFGSVVWWKIPVLKEAASRFITNINSDVCTCGELVISKYNTFKEEQSFWLDDYALFMSIKEFYDTKAQAENKSGAMWSNYWPIELVRRDEKAINEWKKSHEHEIEVFKVIQLFFYMQWYHLKDYANKKGIAIIGDIPIFVAADSADVWANQNLFQLDNTGKSTAVAGVPPDYFSSTGQLWGNPLYNWDVMAKDGYAWWINRIKTVSQVVDLVRIDHFRGFESYWSVPAGEPTAINGKWIKGPGAALLTIIQKELGEIPIIAEDLGIITDDVRVLRDAFSLPGMKVLQFGFDLNEEQKGALVNSFLPHMYGENCIVYTGTHDNDTTKGWLDSLAHGDDYSQKQLALIAEYLGVPKTKVQKDENGCGKDCYDTYEICYRLVRAAFGSTAKYAVVPLQDVYMLGSEARMNTPSTRGGTNWQWRMTDKMLTDKEKAGQLAQLSVLFAR